MSDERHDKYDYTQGDDEGDESYVLRLVGRASELEASLHSAETFTDADMERMWQAAGGEFHGPNVETGTMPKVNLMRFLHELVSVAQRPRLQSATRRIDGVDWCTLRDGCYQPGLCLEEKRCLHPTDRGVSPKCEGDK